MSGDDNLGRFLRAHAEAPPPAGADLEARIMAAVRKPSRRHRHTLRWLAGTAAAAGLAAVLAWPQQDPRETAELAEFVEATWDASVAPADDGTMDPFEE